MLAKNKSLGSTIGKGLAYLQDTVDVGINWCFRSLKNAQVKEEDPEPWKRNSKKALNVVTRFLGDVGESFYEEYEVMKAKRQKKA
ncbi:MAG: hypothetical protein Q8P95_02860 [bacterium]|nr:hypothetical protein [bacterium]